VYKFKYNSNETLEQHKLHLVILDNNQFASIDFKETFVLVAMCLLWLSLFIPRNSIIYGMYIQVTFFSITRRSWILFYNNCLLWTYFA